MKVVAVVLAGGVGKRIGADKPKQFVDLKGVPILIHTLKRFEDLPVVIVMKNEWISYTETLLKGFKIENVLGIVKGGDTRQESSFYGTLFLKEHDPEYVLIHDAARCLVSKGLIEKLIDEIKGSEFDGVIPLIPVSDSLVYIRGEDISYIERDRVRAVQTPQIFKFKSLFKAHRFFYGKKIFDFTDEGSMLLKLGFKLKRIEGEKGNIKISNPLDIEIAERILENE